jgi:alpha,alpha-trehalose phosphorylase
MIHHERLRPPSHDYPADEWNVIEKGFHPEFLAQLETMLALGNGYLGMRGCPEEGGPSVENSTLINGFYETRPIVYPEDAFGLAKTGQTIFSVTDSKTIKLFVDDEPFWLPNANLLSYDRRLNMKSGTLDREIVWETPAGKQVSITSRRLVSFANRHVAAISYQVTLLDAAASLVISSEMAAHEPVAHTNSEDPRQARVFPGRVLHPRASYAKDRRIVLCHATEKSRLTLACATDHLLETSCQHAHKVAYTEDFGQVAFTVEARPGCPIHLTKFMVYHTSQTALAEELCGRAEWTMDRVVRGSSNCSPRKSSTWMISGAAAMSGSGISGKNAQSAAPSRSSKRSASTSFTFCRPRRARKTRACRRRASPDERMRGTIFGTPRSTCCRF